MSSARDAPRNRPRPEGPRRRRVFFGLWPDESTRAALVKTTRRAVHAAGGRPTPRENLHITIAFLGALEPDELDRARDVPPIRTGPFELTLDTLGYWARPRILWLSPSGQPDALGELERALWDGLAAQGFERERKVFMPHVTLSRRARAVNATVKPVRWAAERLTLLESVPVDRGVRYEPIGDWPL